MTPKSQDLDALEEKARAATPGPWFPCANEWAASVHLTDGDILIYDEGSPNRATAEYIAALSPDVVLSLIGEVRELRYALADLAAAIVVYLDTEPLPATQADIVEAHADAQTPLGIARLRARALLASPTQSEEK